MKTVLTDSEMTKLLRDSWKDNLPSRPIATARAIEVAVIKKLEAEHRLIQDTLAEQHEGLQSSLIRANMAALAEAVMKGNFFLYKDAKAEQPFDAPNTAIEVRLNLADQRTVWDRVDLETKRNPDQTEVWFKVFLK